MSQLELQLSIERFTGEFMDSVAEAAEALHHDKQAALTRVLQYGSAALDIACGRLPEMNLLDMLVFILLSRQVLEEHWIPQVFGADGSRLVEAFTDAEARLWTLSEPILSAQQRQELRTLVRDWRAAHATQVRVEWVRFADFEVVVGDGTRARTARGLFGSIKSAAQTADEALLLAERAIFLSNRLPFLIRLQARLAAHEVLTDSLRALPSGQAVDRGLRRGVGYLIVLGAALSLLFWGGYYFAKRGVAASREPPSDVRGATRSAAEAVTD